MKNCTIPGCTKEARGVVNNLLPHNPISNGRGDILILHEIGGYKICEDHMILLQEYNPILDKYTTLVYGLPN